MRLLYLWNMSYLVLMYFKDQQLRLWICKLMLPYSTPPAGGSVVTS